MNEQNGHPERIVPDDTSSGIIAIYLKRYDFAHEFVAGKRVLGVACGVGYGTHYLAEAAHFVVGADIDTSAIHYAIHRYGEAANLAFMQTDAGKLPFATSGFDVVCSFETIEHLPDVESYLKEVRRVLAPGGIFLLSTPAARRTTHSPANPHHLQEWTSADFRSLLAEYFPSVTMYSQFRRMTRLATLIKDLDVFKLRTKVSLSLTRAVAHSVGVQSTGDVDIKDVLIVPDVQSNASEIVVVCSVRN